MARDAMRFEDMREHSTGVLWAINRVLFHPRGFALALMTGEGDRVVGWTVLGDGSEPWVFEGDEDEAFRNFEALLTSLRDGPDGSR